MSRIDWEDALIVEVVRPACPSCGCERYVPIRGWSSSDGSRTSRRICRRCSEPYVVISEPPEMILPEFGKRDLDT